MSENTSPGFRVPHHGGNGQINEVVEEAKQGAWAKLPDWLKVVLVAGSVLSGGGAAVVSFLRPSLVEALSVETVEAHMADVERINARLDRYEAAAERNTERILDAIKRRR